MEHADTLVAAYVEAGYTRSTWTARSRAPDDPVRSMTRGGRHGPPGCSPSPSESAAGSERPTALSLRHRHRGARAGWSPAGARPIAVTSRAAARGHWRPPGRVRARRHRRDLARCWVWSSSPASSSTTCRSSTTGRRTAELKHALDQEPRLVFEAHSTDYQSREALARLVADHWAMLKVGPELTFALREALFALAAIEAELSRRDRLSDRVAVIDEQMIADPSHWKGYTRGAATTNRLARRYSYSDRIRYYWPDPQSRARNACSHTLPRVASRCRC